MQRRGPRSQFPACILPKVLQRDLRQIDCRERHRAPGRGGLRIIVYVVHEHAHPLIPRAMCIDSATDFSRRLDFDAVFAGLYPVVWISALHDEVGVAVEKLVLDQSSWSASPD